MDDLKTILQLRNQGFYCSQILIALGLEMQGKTNVDLLRSVQGLAGGIGFSGGTCGALTGAACLLGLYAGKGNPEDVEDERLNLMLLDLVNWFTRGPAAAYTGLNCDQIIEGRQANIPLRCPGIVQSVWQKCKELLVEYGYNLDGTDNSH